MGFLETKKAKEKEKAKAKTKTKTKTKTKKKERVRVKKKKKKKEKAEKGLCTHPPLSIPFLSSFFRQAKKSPRTKNTPGREYTDGMRRSLPSGSHGKRPGKTQNSRPFFPRCR